MEDIIDTGKTLRRVCDTLAAAGAASVKVVVLLDKAERRTVDIQPDFRALHVGLVLARCNSSSPPCSYYSLCCRSVHPHRAQCKDYNKDRPQKHPLPL